MPSIVPRPRPALGRRGPHARRRPHGPEASRSKRAPHRLCIWRRARPNANHASAALLIGVDHPAHILGIKSRQELGRRHQIAEQDRQLAPLGLEFAESFQAVAPSNSRRWRYRSQSTLAGSVRRLLRAASCGGGARCRVLPNPPRSGPPRCRCQCTFAEPLLVPRQAPARAAKPRYPRRPSCDG